VTLEQLLKIGKTNLTSKVKLLEEDGGGYMVSLEVFHLLHCLVRMHVVSDSLLLTYI
jgi:mycotoxin biosynthesis protein UstYa